MIDGARVIDAHQHFRDLEAGGYAWLGPKYGVINRSFAIADVEPLAEAAAGVDDVVPAEADDTLADTEAMIRIVGIRHLMHKEPDPDRVVSPPVQRGLAALERAGLPNDLVGVLPRHFAKPPIAAGERQPWAGLMAAAAQFPSVSAKISGLDTAAGDNYMAAAIRPYDEQALEHFGADRRMFGSDRPVSVLADGSATLWQTVLEVLDPLTADESVAVFGGTSRHIYGLRSAG